MSKFKDKILYRSEDKMMIAGIAGGLSDYFGFDVSVIRIIFVLLTIFGGGSGLIIYIAMWIIVPLKSDIDKGKDGKVLN
jgi:phage shock protein PspC (stress-responsive transcriptional regulator)